MALTVGTRLGTYEIINALGAGGMSACGYAEPRTVNPRLELGPAADIRR